MSFQPYHLQFLTITVTFTPSWGKGERYRDENVRNSARDTSLEILKKYSGQTKTLQKLTSQKSKITTVLLHVKLKSTQEHDKIFPPEQSCYMLVYTDSFPVPDLAVMTNSPTEKCLLQLHISGLIKLLNHPSESSKINFTL